MFGAFVGRIPKLSSWDPQQVTHILVLRGLNNLRIDPGMSTCKLLKPQQLWEVRMWGLRHEHDVSLKRNLCSTSWWDTWRIIPGWSKWFISRVSESLILGGCGHPSTGSWWKTLGGFAGFPVEPFFPEGCDILEAAHLHQKSHSYKFR